MDIYALFCVNYITTQSNKKNFISNSHVFASFKQETHAVGITKTYNSYLNRLFVKG